MVTEKQLQNLKKGVRFTPERAAMYGKQYHAKGVETRKKKRAVANMCALISQGKVNDDNLKEKLTACGIAEEDQVASTAVAYSLYTESLTGDVAAIRTFNEYCEKGGILPEIPVPDAEEALEKAKANYFEKIDPSFYVLAGKALNHRYTHFEVSGGRGSTKSSWTSLTVIRIMMEHPEVHALVLRKVANTLRDSVYAQYRWAIQALGVQKYWEEKKSPPELVYKPTGQRILFRGADDPTKIKSIKTPFGYIGITHFEEKDQFAGREEIDSILQSTMRGGELFWNFETYNPPRSKDNWANRDSLEERENRIQHRSSCLDLDHREWLGEAFAEEAESLKERDEKRYRHEYLGEPVGIGGNVFENIEERTITDAEIRSFDRIYQGVDWGWFPDRYAFIRLHYDRAHETIYLLDEHSGNKMSNEETAAWIRRKGYDDEEVTCDTSERKSIADYRSLGVNAKGARKGPGSVEYGMKWLQHRTIVIDRKRTPQAWKEFVHYEYEQNRQGEWISGYPDRDNHLIDATRYALERVSGKYRSQA